MYETQVWLKIIRQGRMLHENEMAQLDFVGSIRLREAGAWILALPSCSRPSPGGGKDGDPL